MVCRSGSSTHLHLLCILLTIQWTTAFYYSYTPIFPTSNHVQNSSLKLLLVEKNYAIFGTVGKAFNLSLDTLELSRTLTWTDDDTPQCTDSMSYDCESFVRVFLRYNETNLFYVCSTHFGKPMCRRYTLDAETGGYSMVEGSQNSGLGKCPHRPDVNTTALLHGDYMYVGTELPLSSHGTTYIITKITTDPDSSEPPINTDPTDKLFLIEPQFVSEMSIDNNMLMFFREEAIEYRMFIDKPMVSRVAKVCADDPGTPSRRQWTTLVKATLRCALPDGDGTPFDFPELQSVTPIARQSQLGQDVFYALFTTPRSSIGGSAVCAYRLADVLSALAGDFRSGAGSDQSSGVFAAADAATKWPYETPHPADCKVSRAPANGTSLYGEKEANFITNAPLLYGAIHPIGGRPVYVQTAPETQLTTIAVDFNRATPDGARDVIFAGNEAGSVSKLTVRQRVPMQRRTIQPASPLRGSNPPATPYNPADVAVLSSVRVLDNPVQRLLISDPSNTTASRLVVVGHDLVRSLPKAFCFLQESCSTCAALQDPDCGWSIAEDRCVELGSDNSDIIRTGSDACGKLCGRLCHAATTAAPPTSSPPPPPQRPVPTPSDARGKDDSRSELEASPTPSTARLQESQAVAKPNKAVAGDASLVAGVAVAVLLVGLLVGIFIGTFLTRRLAAKKTTPVSSQASLVTSSVERRDKFDNAEKGDDGGGGGVPQGGGGGGCGGGGAFDPPLSLINGTLKKNGTLGRKALNNSDEKSIQLTHNNITKRPAQEQTLSTTKVEYM